MHDVLDELRASFAGQYEIERELAGGGMSRLFLATERVLGRQVVIKVLPPELTSAVGAARFRRETEVTARLQHPNILPILSAGAHGNVLYYVMPFVAGESLRARMAREGAFAIPDALRVLIEVADALACAHEAGVIHRDIKPENVLLQSGHALLADFGVAAALSGDGSKVSGEQQKLTRTGTSPGTIGYMAPEQLAGDTEVDARADVYSVGVVAYELLAGRRLFEADNAQAMLVAHLVDDPEPLEVVRFDCPGHISRVIERALAKKPEERWQTAAELRDALQRSLAAVLSAEGGVERDPLGRRMKVAVKRLRSSMTTRRVTAPQGIARYSPRTRWLAAAVLLIVFGSVAGILVARTRSADPGETVSIAIAPFQIVRADLDPELELWRQGIVDVLASTLHGAGALRTVSPRVSLARAADRNLTRRDAAGFGRALRARYALVGQLVASGDRAVSIKALLVETSRDSVVLEYEERLPIRQAVDSLSFAVVERLGELHRIGASRGMTSLSTTSALALREFLRGEQYYRQTAWDSAFSSYSRSVEADSLFALPLRRMALVREWQIKGDDSTAALLALRAGRVMSRLSPRDSLLVTADSIAAALNVFRRKGSAVDWTLRRRLFETLNRAAADYPDDPEVWYTLGEARFHHGFGSVAGVTERETLNAFDRAIQLDSAFAPAYVHAVTLALTLDGAAAGRRYSVPYLGMQPTDRHAGSLRVIDKLIGSELTNAEAAALLDSTSTEVLQAVQWAVLRWPDPAHTGHRVLRAMERRLRQDDPNFDSQMRELRIAMTNSLAYRGRFSEAYAFLGDRRWRLFSELAYLGGIPPSHADSSLRAWLSDGPDAVYPALSWWAERRDTSALRMFQDAAARAVTRAGAGPDALASRRRASYQLDGAMAYRALARADTLEATRRFSMLSDTLCEKCYADRLTLARLLASQRRFQEAAVVLEERFYATITPLEILFDLERGRVAASLRRPSEARASYERVISAWGNGERAAQRYVAQARAGLASLRMVAAAP